MRSVSMLILVGLTTGIAGAQSPEPRPAFAGQTDAPAPPASAPFETEIVTDELTSPWSLAFLPNGTFLVTENGGTMRVVDADGSVSLPIEGMPGVRSVGAEGLHEVLLDPDFTDNRIRPTLQSAVGYGFRILWIKPTIVRPTQSNMSLLNLHVTDGLSVEPAGGF